MQTHWLCARTALVLFSWLPAASGAAQTRVDGPGQSVEWSVKTGDGVTLHGESFGTGPDLLFVHGGPSFPPLERPAWLAKLAATRRVHLFHQRGSGRSSRPIERLPADEEEARALLLETYGLEPNLRDIGLVLDACVGEEKTATLVGHSFGAYLAAIFAADEPERVRELVLLAPADVLDGDLTDKSAFERIADALPEEERATYRKRLADFLSPPALAGATDADLARRSDWFGWYFLKAMGWSIPRPDTYPAMRWAGGCAVVGAFIGLGERGDATGDLASVLARTLVLHAGGDLSPPAASEAYARAIPGASFLVVPATAHFFRSAANETAARIEAFLREGS